MSDVKHETWQRALSGRTDPSRWSTGDYNPRATAIPPTVYEKHPMHSKDKETLRPVLCPANPRLVAFLNQVSLPLPQFFFLSSSSLLSSRGCEARPALVSLKLNTFLSCRVVLPGHSKQTQAMARSNNGEYDTSTRAETWLHSLVRTFRGAQGHVTFNRTQLTASVQNNSTKHPICPSSGLRRLACIGSPEFDVHPFTRVKRTVEEESSPKARGEV